MTRVDTTITVDELKDNFIEFDSMINIRPSWGNRTRGVDNPEIQKRIRNIVSRLVTA